MVLCRLFVQRDGGKAVVFCIFLVEKRAVPLGRETAL